MALSAVLVALRLAPDECVRGYILSRLLVDCDRDGERVADAG